MTEPTIEPMGVTVLSYQGEKYVGVRVSGHVYALTCEQARQMAMFLFDAVAEAETA